MLFEAIIVNLIFFLSLHVSGQPIKTSLCTVTPSLMNLSCEAKLL
jgi:hypothetical protein